MKFDQFFIAVQDIVATNEKSETLLRISQTMSVKYFPLEIITSKRR